MSNIVTYIPVRKFKTTIMPFQKQCLRIQRITPCVVIVLRDSADVFMLTQQHYTLKVENVKMHNRTPLICLILIRLIFINTNILVLDLVTEICFALFSLFFQELQDLLHQYPQALLVKKKWLESCFANQRKVNESTYVIRLS